MTKPKLRITGEHISKDGKNKCIHYSDGVVVIEPIMAKIDTCKKCGRADVGLTETHDGKRLLCDDCWE